MKKYKNLLFYITTIGSFGLLMYWFVQMGGRLEAKKITETIILQNSTTGQQFLATYRHNLIQPFAILLLQIITIIIIARFFGFLCKKIGQPSVIGEIIAGIFLGPSFLGLHFPEFSSFLFPYNSLGNLQFLSQIGLILFMFIVGMELNLNVIKNKAKDALVISHASIIIPFALGIGLAYFTYLNFAPANVKFLSYGLFLGIAMSITAFPVLARIVQERDMTKTRIGAIVITCAAIDDITAWCILAIVIAIAKAGSFISSLYTILLAIGYVIIMLKIVQPFFKRMGSIYSHKEGLDKPVVAIFFITLFLSSYATELIGIHALFGAFMAGVIMPSDQNFRSIFIEKIEDIALVLLMPIFFVLTGLRTEIGLLNDIYLWEVCGLTILVAIAGKFAGSAFAAKFVGQNWRDSLIIGALMNTRGLIELVVLNIGYDLGILKPEIFAMMVIMALFTTLMTGPALDLINWLLPEKKDALLPSKAEEPGKYKILISFGYPQHGKAMLRLVNSWVRLTHINTRITALHLSPSNEINQINIQEYERESLQPVIEEAHRLNLTINTLFKPSPDIYKEIVKIANSGNYDVMIIGSGKSVYEGTLLGRFISLATKIINPDRLIDMFTGKENLFEKDIFDENIRQIIKSCKIPVGIFINKGLIEIQNILIPIFSSSDYYLLEYAQKLIQNSKLKLKISVINGALKHPPDLLEKIRSIEEKSPNHIVIIAENKVDKELLDKQNLLLISHDSWKKTVRTQSSWLAFVPSVLIIKS
jgi:Kef-type K+ transport system membrane component KefB